MNPYRESLRRRGWRPALGWLCVWGVGYVFALQPVGSWLAALFSAPAFPPLSWEAVSTLLGVSLGVGGMRTVERVAGARYGAAGALPGDSAVEAPQRAPAPAYRPGAGHSVAIGPEG